MSGVHLKDWTSEYYVANESECKVLLENSDCLRQVPSLNCTSLDELRHGQLVKFRGMIQDMYSPEYYYKEYSVVNESTGVSTMRNGMYMDSAKCLNKEGELIDTDSNKNVAAQRNTWVVLSIPGLNDWAKEKATIRTKESQLTCNVPAKRELCKEELMDCSQPLRKKEKTLNALKNSDPMETNNTKLSKEHIMNFPIPVDDGKVCIVKIYDEKICHKLNEIVDIVGFISLDPTLGMIGNSDDTIDDPEILTHNPPVSLVSRLHAIKIVAETPGLSSPDVSTIFTKAESIRSDLHMVLSQLMFGDSLAADYVICHLISAVHTRRNELCLGNFPLNITNFPTTKYKTFAKDLYRIIATLVPKSHYLGLTLEGLNDMNLLPQKDFECDRLTSGVLQLSKNTHLVIDETVLTTGRVSASGRKNYEAVSELIHHQRVNYDFKYYTTYHEVDIPVLILSEAKSIVPGATQIVLKIDEQTEDLFPSVVEAAGQYLRDEERLSNIRDYLLALRHAECEFGEEICDVIQEDFVNLRQTEKDFSADNLHLLMVIARLMSLSRGNNSLNLDCWKETVQQEIERIKRLPQRKK